MHLKCKYLELIECKDDDNNDDYDVEIIVKSQPHNEAAYNLKIVKAIEFSNLSEKQYQTFINAAQLNELPSIRKLRSIRETINNDNRFKIFPNELGKHFYKR